MWGSLLFDRFLLYRQHNMLRGADENKTILREIEKTEIAGILEEINWKNLSDKNYWTKLS
ncbi:MAG: hypothetical protein AB7U72_11200, partial [Methanosarcina sp.]